MCGHQITTPPAAAAKPPAAAAAAPAKAPPGAPGGAALPKPPGAIGVRGRAKDGSDPFIGQLLNNRFKIESKLGEGGFGAVYKGVQQGTGRKVALKLLHPEMTRDENLVARFRREGLVLCNLRDPHTITTYDFDQTPDGTLYIAMELLEGKSLHQVFHSEAPIEWKRVLKIIAQMCSSLGEAHKQGIVHRDLKPENIYLENRGGDPEFVKILDFGIAKVMRGDNTVDPQAPQLTATGQTLGTLEYMSPEQLMGKQLDGRSDVYALGVLAYELLTGRLPFPDAKGPAALITAQLKQTPKPPSQANPGGGIPVGVDRIVAKTLEKNKDHRFPDVGALASAAQECIASGGMWGTDAAAAGAGGAGAGVAGGAGAGGPGGAGAGGAGGPGAGAGGAGAARPGSQPVIPTAAAGRNRGNPALVATTRGDPGGVGAPPGMPQGGMGIAGQPTMPPIGGSQRERAQTPQPMQQTPPSSPNLGPPVQSPAPQSYPSMPPYGQQYGQGPQGAHAGPNAGPHAGPHSGPHAGAHSGPHSGPHAGPHGHMHAHGAAGHGHAHGYAPPVARKSPLVWIVLAVLVIAAGVGAALAMTL